MGLPKKIGIISLSMQCSLVFYSSSKQGKLKNLLDFEKRNMLYQQSLDNF